MRGNLPQNEPKRYAKWFAEDAAYEKMKNNRKNAEKQFIYMMDHHMQMDTFILAMHLIKY